MKIYKDLFSKIISLENLFSAWDAFKRDKRDKRDVQQFEWRLEENIFELHRDLAGKTYRHGPYTDFYIRDPKQRHIHKASVRDRVVHHTIFSILNPIFEPTFIADSYSCRVGKGTHRGVNRLRAMLRKASKNNTQPCYTLKCDVKKFFESVDHGILLGLIEKRIKDQDAMWLIKEILGSFTPGIPIGNLTSQLFANIYLNELDQFVKHTLKIPYYIRYTDDFVMLSGSRTQLEEQLAAIRDFLSRTLALELHPQKITLLPYHRGIDFLGYVQFPHHRLLRTKTRRRILSKIARGVSEQSLQSYLGVLSHTDSYTLKQHIKNLYWFSRK